MPEVVMVSTLKDVPIKADMDLDKYNLILGSGDFNDQITGEVCRRIMSAITDELAKLKLQKKRNPNDQVHKDMKEHISLPKDKVTEDASTDLSVHSFCFRNNKQVVDYTNTKCNCLF